MGTPTLKPPTEVAKKPPHEAASHSERLDQKCHVNDRISDGINIWCDFQLHVAVFSQLRMALSNRAIRSCGSRGYLLMLGKGVGFSVQRLVDDGVVQRSGDITRTAKEVPEVHIAGHCGRAAPRTWVNALQPGHEALFGLFSQLAHRVKDCDQIHNYMFGIRSCVR